ncbi:SGNH/GDSL hydrolase family protein [Mucilaginibacter sp. KACC 22063]|uniref:SGNH/GDSL hydrolase family protein n=1 Tax=Mucilaginibacter sp. KACC 22063 TaxID=3025666 RepID=UPI0023661968|nr:SGNH/GDSL hydrolase family protein [Mucilaginibacter sp. KACC 22063]WDF55396.1 SGNH/GDSL hydrolase family protein [Mucilaginibacter sp. KACC 22063]
MKNLWLIFLSALILLACSKQKSEIKPVVKSTAFSNVVILGNSITYSQQNLSIGWMGNWGMAASVPEKDYVHLLAAHFKAENANCSIQSTNISGFELGYNTYDLDANLKAYRYSKPDLLILRIGENVQSTFDSVAFAKRYQALINYMKVGNPDLKVLAAGSFWPDRGYVNTIMSRYTPYISLEFLGRDISNYAFDLQNVDASVQGHPGDKGMQKMADTIWATVKKMK